MNIIKFFFILLFLIVNSTSSSNALDFNDWLLKFKNEAINDGISSQTVNSIMDKAVFLPKVIKYDRYQPEFYEDTLTYIGKRSNKKKVINGINLYKKHNNLINKIEKEFSVEKELLLALMAVETNYGKYLGKMDIVSSLATLSFDKRRSEFFTEELLILLKLIDNKIISPETLYGSWAGAFGNFQFMPRTIQNYAIDYNSNSKIELKSVEDSFASAANYINKIGWSENEPCFYEVELNDNTPTKLLNTSPKKINNKKKIKILNKIFKK